MMGLWGKESTYTKLLQRISEKNEEGLELRRQSLQNGRMYHWILSNENGRRAMSLDTYLNIVHALESSPTVLMSQQHPEKHIERFSFMMNQCDEREIEFALHMIEQILRGQEDYLSE